MNDPLPSNVSDQKREKETERERKWRKSLGKNMSFILFGWEMILPDERRVVTSCMHFTKNTTSVVSDGYPLVSDVYLHICGP